MNNRFLILIAPIFLVVSLLASTACSSADKSGSEHPTETIKQPAGPPGIRGIITRADSTAGSSNILVEEDPADASGSNKASVRINEETKIYRRSGGSLEKSIATALTIGKQVSVWFEGPVAESYPVQGSASVVVLED